MSTRCNVWVKEKGLVFGDSEKPIQLYHHCDGYPTNMLSLFRQAFDRYGKGWEAGRAGKVAGMICAVDPGQFEPENGSELHGDIEYWYKITVQNVAGGTMAEQPKWFVEVYTSHDIQTNVFCANGSEDIEGRQLLLRKLAGPITVKQASQQRKAIEKRSSYRWSTDIPKNVKVLPQGHLARM